MAINICYLIIAIHIHIGLPAVLSQYELQFLLEKGIIELIEKTGLSIAPSDAHVEQYQAFREQCIADQKEHLRQTKVEESRKVIDKIIIGKRKKLLKSGVKEEDINLEPNTILQKIYESCTFEEDNALLQIPTQHPFNDVGNVSIIFYVKVFAYINSY